METEIEGEEGERDRRESTMRKRDGERKRKGGGVLNRVIIIEY